MSWPQAVVCRLCGTTLGVVHGEPEAIALVRVHVASCRAIEPEQERLKCGRCGLVLGFPQSPEQRGEMTARHAVFHHGDGIRPTQKEGLA